MPTGEGNRQLKEDTKTTTHGYVTSGPNRSPCSPKQHLSQRDTYW
jgi:hypothetical protein